jgi:ribonuclease BN (tRNA processing enzyme)
MKLIFLGTGGGRFVMARQLRSTAGLQLKIDDKLLHIDPGPGTLLRYKMMKLDPSKLDVVLVSHNHPDHCIDSVVLVEAMAGGTSRKKGTWIVNPTFSKFVTDFHKKVPENFVVMKPGDQQNVGVKITAIKCEHTDEETIGFLIEGKEGSVYYTSDTGLLPEHLKIKADIIVSNFTTLKGNGRMGVDENVELAKRLKPRKMIITHFGIR